MTEYEENKLIDESLQKFTSINRLQTSLATDVSKRVTFLYRTMFIGFFLVVGAFFFMTFVLSTHMSEITGVITNMNNQFTNMNDNMQSMLQSMNKMDKNVDSMVEIVSKIDSMQHNVAFMSADMNVIHQEMGVMKTDMVKLSQQVTDMKYSFRVMDGTVMSMSRDVDHLSSPMRLFNFFK